MPKKKTRRGAPSDRGRPPRAHSKPTWTEKTPNKEGWYWYRDKDRDVVLHVFDPMHNGVMKAWDWYQGRLTLCAIAAYDGLWYGPLEVPR
jgi:hypothetical protein